MSQISIFVSKLGLDQKSNTCNQRPKIPHLDVLFDTAPKVRAAYGLFFEEKGNFLLVKELDLPLEDLNSSHIDPT